MVGHAIAGTGLYWDVAWHIDIGRDEALFTIPHLMILAGLLVISLSTGVALLLAARDGFKLPKALIAVAFSTGLAVVGFPLDELWHQARGIDVTMWSPTHLLMIGGGGLAVLPLWFALGEAGVRPTDGRGARLMHWFTAVTLLGGLSSFQGEYDFGVPQFQLLYHPVIVLIAGGLVLTAARIVLGRFGALSVAAAFLAFRTLTMVTLGPMSGHTVPRVALYVGLALTIELVALVVIPRRGLVPFALVSGAAVGTVGLATEWAWANTFFHHPWTSALLPEAVLLGLVAAIGVALLGTGIGSALDERLPRMSVTPLAIGGLLVIVALLVPFPRTSASSPQASVSFEPVLGSDGSVANIRVVIGPPDAPYNARWWEVMAWQAGPLHLSPLIPSEGSGVYVTSTPVPITGDWKVSLRLHRGSDLLVAELKRPADPEFGLEAIEPTNRFVSLRAQEITEPGTENPSLSWLGPVVLAAVALLFLGWTVLTVRGGIAARTALEPPPPPSRAKRDRSERGGRKLRQG